MSTLDTFKSRDGKRNASVHTWWTGNRYISELTRGKTTRYRATVKTTKGFDRKAALKLAKDWVS